MKIKSNITRDKDKLSCPSEESRSESEKKARMEYYKRMLDSINNRINALIVLFLSSIASDVYIFGSNKVFLYGKYIDYFIIIFIILWSVFSLFFIKWYSGTRYKTLFCFLVLCSYMLPSLCFAVVAYLCCSEREVLANIMMNLFYGCFSVLVIAWPSYCFKSQVEYPEEKYCNDLR